MFQSFRRHKQVWGGRQTKGWADPLVCHFFCNPVCGLLHSLFACFSPCSLFIRDVFSADLFWSVAIQGCFKIWLHLDCTGLWSGKFLWMGQDKRQINTHSQHFLSRFCDRLKMRSFDEQPCRKQNWQPIDVVHRRPKSFPPIFTEPASCSWSSRAAVARHGVLRRLGRKRSLTSAQHHICELTLTIFFATSKVPKQIHFWSGRIFFRHFFPMESHLQNRWIPGGISWFVKDLLFTRLLAPLPFCHLSPQVTTALSRAIGEGTSSGHSSLSSALHRQGS